MTRVDNVPLLYRPFFYLYGWVFGVALFLFTLLIHYSCRIRYVGTDLKSQPNYILCIWHESLAPFFSVYTDMSDQIWMNHPAWYMKPIHVLLKLTGVKHICLGSTGNSGKEALANVISYLRKGYNTSVACDGPAGPAYDLKPGTLLMSIDTGVPVIPLRFECSRFFRLGGWDRKILPLPFSEIVVYAGAPVIVTQENFDNSHKEICDWLNLK